MGRCQTLGSAWSAAKVVITNTWLLKKSVFLKKVENRVIESVQETEKNRLQSFLTRSNFYEFLMSEFFNSHRDYHYLSQSEIAGSIKGDVNKKASPSAGSREVFCLDIQPTVCRYGPRSLERFFSGLLFRSLGFIVSW